MHISEIENNLPNGFHDSRINSITIHYDKSEAEIGLSICITSPFQEMESELPRYTNAKIQFRQLKTFSIENSNVFLQNMGSGFLVTSGSFEDLPNFKQKELPLNMQTTTLFWFFISALNIFIFIDSLEAELFFEDIQGPA